MYCSILNKRLSGWIEDSESGLMNNMVSWKSVILLITWAHLLVWYTRMKGKRPSFTALLTWKTLMNPLLVIDCGTNYVMWVFRINCIGPSCQFIMVCTSEWFRVTCGLNAGSDLQTMLDSLGQWWYIFVFHRCHGQIAYVHADYRLLRFLTDIYIFRAGASGTFWFLCYRKACSTVGESCTGLSTDYV
jgi:hypothetical protein